MYSRGFCTFHAVLSWRKNTFLITPHYLHILEHIGSIMIWGDVPLPRNSWKCGDGELWNELCDISCWLDFPECLGARQGNEICHVFQDIPGSAASRKLWRQPSEYIKCWIMLMVPQISVFRTGGYYLGLNFQLLDIQPTVIGKMNKKGLSLLKNELKGLKLMNIICYHWTCLLLNIRLFI